MLNNTLKHKYLIKILTVVSNLIKHLRLRCFKCAKLQFHHYKCVIANTFKYGIPISIEMMVTLYFKVSVLQCNYTFKY